MRQVYARGTGFLAGLAVQAVLDDGPGIGPAVVKIGQDQADGPDVDVAVVVAAHQRVNRADVGAGAAADAAQGLGKERVLGQSQAAVVQKNNMQLFFSVRRGQTFRGPGDPGDIRGNGLTGGALGQDLENPQGRGQVGNQLVQAHQGDVNLGKCGHQSGVALIADNPQGTGLGHGKIGPADAHIGRQKGLAQFFAGHPDQGPDVIRLLLNPGDLTKEVGHLLAGQVNGRHHHMGRAFVPQLDDPLSQVRLHHLEPLSFQMQVEKGLLRGHGL